MSKEFQIVDGVAKGYATASVEVSLDVPLSESPVCICRQPRGFLGVNRR